MEDSVSNFLTDLFLQKPLAYESNWSRNGQGGFVPCGSASEFYIVPLLPCISDNDVLFSMTNNMAFSGHNVVLPNDIRCFEETIQCVLIEPYKNYPGFVQLLVVGNLIYNWEQEKYDFFEATKRTHISVKMMQRVFEKQLKGTFVGPIFGVKSGGPAVKKCIGRSVYDDVNCVCCPVWPREAKEWPTRRKNCEWPEHAIIEEVVRNGCHVVCAQHRDCYGDDLQFRFSFSLAEVILLRTWTSTQQLVYHMLRFLAKRKLIDTEVRKEKKFLLTYHLKTLMMWACEQESADWWKSSTVIAICCKLLRRLSEWMEKRHCQNYFIPEANMFGGKIDPIIVKFIIEKLEFFCDRSNLSQWFVDNYLLECYTNLIEGRSPHEFGEFPINRLYQTLLRNKGYEQLQLFDDRFTAISCTYMIGVWMSRKISFTVINNRIKDYARMYKDSSMSAWYLSTKNRSVLESESPFIYLDSALCMLNAANTLACKPGLNANDFLSNILSVVSLGTTTSSDRRRYHNFPKTYPERLPKSYCCFLIAQDRMGKICRPGDSPQFQLMTRLSMQYLRISYTTKDVSNRIIRNATLVYMAAICFATLQFDAAIDLCSQIMQNTQPVSTSKIPERHEEPLRAGCLVFIDDVSNCVGFIELFQHIIKGLRPDYRQFGLNLQLTPRVLAEYIIIQAAERISRPLRVNWSEHPSVYLTDSIFKQIVRRKSSNVARCRSSRMCFYRRHDRPEVEEVLDRLTVFSLHEDVIVPLLMECSLESIATLYQKISDDYGVRCHTVVSCYRALYQYKLCRYDNVLRICDKTLDDLKLEEHLMRLSRSRTMFLDMGPNWLAFTHVLAIRPFNAFFDDELLCLIALQVLCHVAFPESTPKCIERITFNFRVEEHHGARNQFDMSFRNLFTPKSCIVQYFLSRHFLARYLKLRCLLSCDQRSASDIFEAFFDLKPHLPFEHVVHQFLLRKLQRNFHY